MGQTKSIYIYGASGHGLVCADIAKLNGYENIIFLDDKKGLKFSPELDKFDIFIAIGDNGTRKTLQDKVLSFGYNIVNLIHPNAVISSSAIFGNGIVIMPGVVINAKAQIEDGAIINTGAIIEHECKIGKFAHISPNSSLAGCVKVGALTHIGIGSSVIQGIIIGKNSIIGAGSVVIRDIASNVVAVGVPAKVIKNLESKV